MLIRGDTILGIISIIVFIITICLTAFTMNLFILVVGLSISIILYAFAALGFGSMNFYFCGIKNKNP